ncbi:DUF4260 domain-containing protein [Actinoplanes sp. NBRC 101535]|uniref:DUF4260 domain-containing protein n=1 Tax=Actinoplanes sp. NBRC 101535 TaxID=3032196 RepID=UPI0024A5C9E2|nr:DUF4260 domain-containing protein [Actinoplanes sp. NBRC 101535]GLY04137.1 hypothetical protein Acsp01_45160 [Actinoplanes sp. NBRC 101535]
MSEQPTTAGVVTGRPLTWLRAEGLAVAAGALALYAGTGQPWWLVPALFLAPDLTWFAYLAGPKVGAWFYNLAHTAPLPIALLAVGAYADITALTVAGAVGLFHIGLDRLMKYGVKYDHGFTITHLGVHGPGKRPPVQRDLLSTAEHDRVRRDHGHDAARGRAVPAQPATQQ